jgi:very-short-patch-repair endonuclease
VKSKLERVMEPRLEEAASALGWSIRRQVRVGRYVLDFLVETPSSSLCVELDGAAWHERTEEQGLRDRQRDRELLRCFSLPTARFLGKEVLRNPEAVMTQIVQIASRLHERRPLP